MLIWKNESPILPSLAGILSNEARTKNLAESHH